MSIVTKNYISSINFLDDREIMRDVLDVTGEDRNILDILEITGREKRTMEPEFHNFTNQYRFQNCEISAIDASKFGDNGDNILITVTDATELPIKGEIAMFQDPTCGLAEVIAVGTEDGLTSTQFEAAPIDGVGTAAGYEIDPTATTNANGTIAVGQKVTFPTDVAEEGSSAPDGKKPRVKKSSNYVQIFKTSGSVTDMQKVSALTVNYNGSPHIMYKVQHDTLMNHRDKIAYGLIVSKRAKVTDATSDKTKWYSQGLINYIRDGYDSTDAGAVTGVKANLSGSAVTKANFRTMSRALDKLGAPDEYWLWAGGDFVDDMEDNIHTDGSSLWVGGSGAISYNSFGSGDGKQRAVDLGIDSFRLGGRTWHLKKMKAFDHPEVFASANYEFGGLAMAIPTGVIKADLSGNTQERLCVRYAAGDGTDLRYLETLTGALAPVPTSTEAKLQVSYESAMGLDPLGIEHFGIFNQ